MKAASLAIVLFILALVAASDGPYFPWPNLFATALMLIITFVFVETER